MKEVMSNMPEFIPEP